MEVYQLWINLCTIYKFINFPHPLIPEIDRIGNSPNILFPRSREQDESHPILFSIASCLNYIRIYSPYFLRNVFQAFYKDEFDRINELSYFKCSLASRLNKLRDTAIDLGLWHTLSKTWNSLLNNNGSLNYSLISWFFSSLKKRKTAVKSLPKCTRKKPARWIQKNLNNIIWYSSYESGETGKCNTFLVSFIIPLSWP